MKRILTLMIFISQVVFSKTASWYGEGFEGKLTASGYIYSSDQLTCASNRYPFGTVLKVTNKENKKSVVVVVIDRGSFTEKYGREIDLSRKAFDKIAVSSKGLIKVDIEVVNKRHIFKYKHGKPKFTKKEYKKYLK